jgi:hypothetical protein
MSEEGSTILDEKRETAQNWDEPLDEDLLFLVIQRLETGKGWRDRLDGLEWLRTQAQEIAIRDRLRNTALNELSRIAARGDNDSLEIIQEIWKAGWEDRPGQILNHVLQVLKWRGSSLQKAASDWVGQMAPMIVQDPGLMVGTMEVLIKVLEDSEEDGLAVQESALEAMVRIWEDANRAGKELWQNLQEDGDRSLRWSVAKTIHRSWKASWRHRPQRVIDGVEDALKFGEWDLRRAAARWVRKSAGAIVKESEYLQRIQNALLFMGDLEDQPPDICRVLKDTLRELWNAGWEVVENQEASRNFILQQVLTALQESREIEIQKTAVDWLGEKAGDIAAGTDAYRRYKPTADALVGKLIEIQLAYGPEESRLAPIHSRPEKQQLDKRIDITLRRLWEDLKKTQYKRQKDLLLDENQDKDTKTNAIWRLADRNTLGTREALRFLAGAWIQWLREGIEPHLVDLTAEVIRYNFYAVLPLIGYFGNPDAAIFDQGGDRSKRHPGKAPGQAGKEPAGEASTAVQIPESSSDEFEEAHLRDHVEKWREKGRGAEILLGEAEMKEAEAFLQRDPAAGADIRKDLEHLVMESRAALEKEKRLWIDFRIAKQLADMSDPAFFEDPGDVKADKILKQERIFILQELKKHAIPVLLERMALEDENGKTPLKIQEIKNATRAHVVRLLGYTGGREAVDALARQVVGKEKQRKDRHDLLDRYYLEPSLKRGEEAAEILNGTVLESTRTLSLLKLANTLVFLIGLALIGYGFYMSLQTGNNTSRVIGGLSVAGGFAGIITLLVRTPLDRIQNAMARLVHAETAFTSFIWQLNLHGTFVQSRYVKNGLLEDGEIKFALDQIEKVIERIMSLVSIHTVEDEPKLVVRLNRLEPVGGEAGTEITITLQGQNLLGDSQHKRDREGMVAINHIPVRQKVLRWTEREVEFKLPVETSARLPDGTAWISLFVDGMETNALPFNLVKKGG